MATDQRRDDEGAGLLPLTWGVFAFLMFLFLAVQVSINLAATSSVSALGHDAARRAALAGGDEAAIAEADAWLRSRLADADVTQMRWERRSGAVVLHLEVEPPDVLINRGGPLSANTIERSFQVRVEQIVERAP